jgi:hypothetical protein
MVTVLVMVPSNKVGEIENAAQRAGGTAFVQAGSAPVRQAVVASPPIVEEQPVFVEELPELPVHLQKIVGEIKNEFSAFVDREIWLTKALQVIGRKLEVQNMNEFFEQLKELGAIVIVKRNGQPHPFSVFFLHPSLR